MGTGLVSSTKFMDDEGLALATPKKAGGWEAAILPKQATFPD